MSAPSVLLIGFGNPGCQDDGLGPAFAEAIAALECDGVTVDADYQLVIEDAHAMAQHDVVVFADADAIGPAPFALTAVQGKASTSFSTHSVRPEALVWMTEQLFGRTVEAYILSIRGRCFEQLTEGLTPEASENLALALRFFEPVLRNRSFRVACAADRTRDYSQCSATGV